MDHACIGDITRPDCLRLISIHWTVLPPPDDDPILRQKAAFAPCSRGDAVFAPGEAQNDLP
jgi:hypothetical protein